MKFLGICRFSTCRKSDSAAGMEGCAVTVVMVLTTAVVAFAAAAERALGLGYLQTIAFILVIACSCRCWKSSSATFFRACTKRWAIYLPLITTNFAVLGVIISRRGRRLQTIRKRSWPRWARRPGAPLLAMVLVSGVRGSAWTRAEPPKDVQGHAHHADLRGASVI